MVGNVGSVLQCACYLVADSSFSIVFNLDIHHNEKSKPINIYMCIYIYTRRRISNARVLSFIEGRKKKERREMALKKSPQSSQNRNPPRRSAE